MRQLSRPPNFAVIEAIERILLPPGGPKAALEWAAPPWKWPLVRFLPPEGIPRSHPAVATPVGAQAAAAKNTAISMQPLGFVFRAQACFPAEACP
jgi:hypothetical protein